MYEEASQVATDAVGSIRTVASFCAEEKMMQLYSKKCEGPMKNGIRQGLISGTGFGVSFFLLFSVYGTSFYAGARLVEDGKATFTDVFRVSSVSSIDRPTAGEKKILSRHWPGSVFNLCAQSCRSSLP